MHIITTDWMSDRKRLSKIRRAVFIDEQNVPEELEWDSDDEDATHFLVHTGGIDIACARLSTDGKIGRMAVVKKYRNKGVGFQLLQYVISYARNNAYPSLYMHAQTSALGFYEKAGFSAKGELFSEAGIPHMEMTLRLARS